MKPTKERTFDQKSYKDFFTQIKAQIKEAQLRASLAVNSELLKLYWSIGKAITEKQEIEGWGTKIIEQLAQDLQTEFPGIQGFSRSNIFRMRSLYLAYKNDEQAIETSPFFLIPWGHNVVLLEQLTEPEERLWYAQKTVEFGWSRSALQDWIKSKLFKRQGKALTNFKSRLPLPQSEMAQEILKDPYKLDFLTLLAGFKEKELEQGLIDHIQKFLIELGTGFAFMGRQYPIEVEGQTYYLDLLFYHTKLHCHVIVDLKAKEFKPEYAGKMNFYLAAVDDTLKGENDNPSIGMILCKSKSSLSVEYAFRNCTTPIGVACYETQITGELPEELRGSLPTVEQIESELGEVNLEAPESGKE